MGEVTVEEVSTGPVDECDWRDWSYINTYFPLCRIPSTTAPQILRGTPCNFGEGKYITKTKGNKIKPSAMTLPPEKSMAKHPWHFLFDMGGA